MSNPNQEKYGDQTKNSEGGNFGGSANTNDVVKEDTSTPVNVTPDTNQNKAPMPMSGDDKY